MVKSGSADVWICGCRNRDRAMVRDRVKIRVRISLGIRLGLGMGLGDGLTTKLQLNYRVNCCDIRRFAIRFLCLVSDVLTVGRRCDQTHCGRWSGGGTAAAAAAWGGEGG